MKKRKKPKHQRLPTFLKAWREFHGWKLEQAAEKADMTAGNLSQIELNQTRYNNDTLEALARIYKCHPGELLMCDPDDRGNILAIWSKLSPEKKQTAVKQLQALVDEQALASSPHWYREPGAEDAGSIAAHERGDNEAHMERTRRK